MTHVTSRASDHAGRGRTHRGDRHRLVWCFRNSRTVRRDMFASGKEPRRGVRSHTARSGDAARREQGRRNGSEFLKHHTGSVRRAAVPSRAGRANSAMCEVLGVSAAATGGVSRRACVGAAGIPSAGLATMVILVRGDRGACGKCLPVRPRGGDADPFRRRHHHRNRPGARYVPHGAGCLGGLHRCEDRGPVCT